MSKLFTRLAGVAAAAALVLSVGVGSAAANVTSYHEANGTVLSITTPASVATAVGTTTKFPVTFSVQSAYPVKLGEEHILTPYGGDSQWDGLTFAHYGCWGLLLAPGQSCTSTLAFTPTFVGTHSEGYMLATDYGTITANFTATGLRSIYGVLAPSSGLLAP